MMMDKPIKLRVPKIEYTANMRALNMVCVKVHRCFIIVTQVDTEQMCFKALFEGYDRNRNCLKFKAVADQKIKGQQFVDIESLRNGDIVLCDFFGTMLKPESILEKKEVSAWNTDELIIGKAYRIKCTKGNHKNEYIDTILGEMAVKDLVIWHYNKESYDFSPIAVSDDGSYEVYAL